MKASNTYFKTAAVAAAAFFCCLGLPAKDKYEGLGKVWRNVEPDARALLTELEKAAAKWKPHVDHSKFLVRGQFFYGLERTKDLHIFYERPLLQDSSIGKFGERGHMLNPESWRRTVSVAREQGLDAFAFFPTNPGCWDLLPRSVMPGGEIPIMGEFHNGDRARGVKHCADVAGRMLAAPNAFRIDGKVVMSCYPAAGWSNAEAIDFWPKLKAEVEARYGKDKFAFMPYLWLFNSADLNKGKMTVETIENTRRHIREVLRKTDGVFYWLTQMVGANHVGHTEVVVPIVKSVLAEPEFKDKFYGIGYWQGHENAYRCGTGDIPSMGFRRLLGALRAIEEAAPDFSVGFEWDEQNENTHFRPTVSNGFTTQRLMRYFSDKVNGRKLKPLPRDEAVTDVPNIMVAYRKMVEAGEPVSFQVLNVPDGTQGSTPWTVSMVWKNGAGKVVKSFPAKSLSAESCDIEVFTMSSVDLVGEEVLYPELTVSSGDGRKQVFSDGFWPLSVAANRCADMKWVRTALRDVPRGVRGAITVGPARKDGTVEVSGKIEGQARFRSIEVLEDSDSVYFYDAKAPDSRPDDQVRLKIALYAMPCFWKHHSGTGMIAVLDAPGARLWESDPYYAKRGHNCWRINQSNKSLNFLNKHYIEMSAAAAKSATVLIDLPDCFPRKEIAVADVVANDRYTFAGPCGSQIAISRERTQYNIPPPAMVEAASFKFIMKPWNPMTLLRLQAVDENYRVWRGKAVVRTAPSGKKVVFSVYDQIDKARREVSAPASRVVRLSYDFSKTDDDAYYSSYWRNLPLVSGGGVGLLTYVGSGDAREYGNALGVRRPNLCALPGCEQTRAVPYKEEDGTTTLSFDGCSFASVPVKAMSSHAGFSISMRLLPLGMKGEEGLLDSDHMGLRLYLKDGVPNMSLSLQNEYARRGIDDPQGPTLTGPRLRKGEWNDLKVNMDQRHAWIEVNGVSGERVPCMGNTHNPAAMAFGVKFSGLGFFHGRLASLSFDVL